MEHHRSWSKQHRLGNLISLCYHLRHNLDMGKVTGNQRKIEFPRIWNNRKKEKMKRIFTFTIILMALTACTALQVQTTEPVATDIPQVNMPNPASVYCEQEGNKLEIRTTADGSQNGV